MNSDKQSRKVPERILKIHREWTHQATMLRTVHGVWVVIATTASILAAVGLGKGWSPVVENPLSVVAAVAIGLVTAFELGNMANSFRNAWRGPFWPVSITNIDSRGLQREPDTPESARSVFLADDNGQPEGIPC